MYYGTRDVQNAGPAHGDVSSGCNDFVFPSTAIGVNFYTDNPYTRLQGMRIKFKNPNSSTSLAIQGGPVEQVGQLKYETVFADGADFQFFGFDTKFEDTTSELKIPSIVTYSPAKYTELKQIILETPGLITDAEDQQQAAKLGQTEWE